MVMGMSVRGEFRLVKIAHIIAIILLHGIVGICAYRRFTKSIKSSRGDFIAMSMGAKSLMFMFWMLGTDMVPFMKRWYSLKCNMILNCLETVLWPATVGFLVYFLIKNHCAAGIACTLSYVVIALSGVMAVVSLPGGPLTYLHWRQFKSTGVHPLEAEEKAVRTQYSESPEVEMKAHQRNGYY